MIDPDVRRVLWRVLLFALAAYAGSAVGSILSSERGSGLRGLNPIVAGATLMGACITPYAIPAVLGTVAGCIWLGRTNRLALSYAICVVGSGIATAITLRSWG